MGLTLENPSAGCRRAKHLLSRSTRQHILTYEDASHAVHVSGAEYWRSLFARLHERLSQKQCLDVTASDTFLSLLCLPWFSPLQVCLHRPTPSPLLHPSYLQRRLLPQPSTLPWVRCCWAHAPCLQDIPITQLQLSYTWTTQPTIQGKQR